MPSEAHYLSIGGSDHERLRLREVRTRTGALPLKTEAPMPDDPRDSFSRELAEARDRLRKLSLDIAALERLAERSQEAVLASREALAEAEAVLKRSPISS